MSPVAVEEKFQLSCLNLLTETLQLHVYQSGSPMATLLDDGNNLHGQKSVMMEILLL